MENFHVSRALPRLHTCMQLRVLMVLTRGGMAQGVCGMNGIVLGGTEDETVVLMLSMHRSRVSRAETVGVNSGNPGARAAMTSGLKAANSMFEAAKTHSI